MNRLLIAILIALSSLGKVDAQELILTDSIELTQVKQLSFDLEGNLYVLSNNSLVKFFPKSWEEANRYKSKVTISHFSFATKWKIYLYSENQILILNNRLSQIGETVTLENKILAVDANNMVWNLGRNNELLKTDLITKQVTLSIRLKHIPEQALLSGDNLFIKSSNQISVYNGAGRLIKAYNDIEGHMLLDQGDLFLHKDQLLTDLSSGDQVKLPINADLMAIGNKQIAIYKDGLIYIYSSDTP